VPAQKVLSTVCSGWTVSGAEVRRGEIVDILVGKRTAKVEQFDHHSLSVFGVGYRARQRGNGAG